MSEPRLGWVRKKKLRHFTGDAGMETDLRKRIYRIGLGQIAATIALIVGSSGCHPPAVTYTPTSSVVSRPPTDPQRIEIVLSARPARAYQAVGFIATRNFNGDVAKSLESMRQKAANVGLDGVANVICAPPGTVGNGDCSGEGFVWAAGAAQ